MDIGGAHVDCLRACPSGSVRLLSHMLCFHDVRCYFCTVLVDMSASLLPVHMCARCASGNQLVARTRLGPRQAQLVYITY